MRISGFGQSLSGTPSSVKYWTELLGLTWADVDLDAARLTVRTQLERGTPRLDSAPTRSSSRRSSNDLQAEARPAAVVCHAASFADGGLAVARGTRLRGDTRAVREFFRVRARTFPRRGGSDLST